MTVSKALPSSQPQAVPFRPLTIHIAVSTGYSNGCGPIPQSLRPGGERLRERESKVIKNSIGINMADDPLLYIEHPRGYDIFHEYSIRRSLAVSCACMSNETTIYASSNLAILSVSLPILQIRCRLWRAFQLSSHK